MNIRFIASILSILFCFQYYNVYAQEDSVFTDEITFKELSPYQVKNDSLLAQQKYEYRLPFLGEKVLKRGYDMPLPIGFSASYVNTSMGMGISDLGVNVSGIDPNKHYLGKNIPQEKLDELISGPVLDLLNDNVTMASASGMNYRMDVFLFPFLNVYGMASQVSGSTSIGTGNSGESGFGSTVNFDALAYGGGFTLAYGYKNWFVSADANYMLSKTDLLEDNIAVGTYSIRVGKRFNINQGKQKFAIYVGAMNRNFTNSNSTPGNILLSEVVNNEIDLSSQITNIYNQLSVPQKALIRSLVGGVPNGSQLNQFLNEMVDNTQVEYEIKKDLLTTWTVQVGFNFEFNKHLSLRGEYGVEENNKFLMTGINYRFGFKKH